jgi:hypothetical protein
MGGGSGTSKGIFKRFLFSIIIEAPVAVVGDVRKVIACFSSSI